MKTAKLFASILLLTALFLSTTTAAEKIIAGPKGGRILESTSPHAEFFVEKSRTVTVTFYDTNLKPIPAANQSVSVVAEPKSGKARIEFEKKGDVLVSKTPLPEGDGYKLTVLYKSAPDAKSQNFRFDYDTGTCGGCKRSEYACTCGH